MLQCSFETLKQYNVCRVNFRPRSSWTWCEIKPALRSLVLQTQVFGSFCTAQCTVSVCSVYSLSAVEGNNHNPVAPLQTQPDVTSLQRSEAHIYIRPTVSPWESQSVPQLGKALDRCGLVRHLHVSAPSPQLVYFSHRTDASSKATWLYSCCYVTRAIGSLSLSVCHGKEIRRPRPDSMLFPNLLTPCFSLWV